MAHKLDSSDLAFIRRRQNDWSHHLLLGIGIVDEDFVGECFIHNGSKVHMPTFILVKPRSSQIENFMVGLRHMALIFAMDILSIRWGFALKEVSNIGCILCVDVDNCISDRIELFLPQESDFSKRRLFFPVQSGCILLKYPPC